MSSGAEGVRKVEGIGIGLCHLADEWWIVDELGKQFCEFILPEKTKRGRSHYRNLPQILTNITDYLGAVRE